MRISHLAGGLLLAALIVNSTVARGDESPDKKAKAPTAPALDARAAEEVKKSLDATLDQPLAKLMEAARKLAMEVKVQLRYDRVIAQLRARESLLEEARVEAQSMVQSTSKERKDLKAQLDKERAGVHEQFKEDAKLAEQEEVAVIEMYLPNLTSLKSQEDRLNQLIKDTSTQLNRVRLQLRSLERQKLMEAKGLGEGMDLLPSLPDLKLDDRPAPDTSGPVRKRSLKEAQDLLKDL